MFLRVYFDSIYIINYSLKLNKIILIGHSFGGKIALCYATKYKTEKLVLLASPYKKKIQNYTYRF